jgi:hypothetical protein
MRMIRLEERTQRVTTLKWEGAGGEESRIPRIRISFTDCSLFHHHVLRAVMQGAIVWNLQIVYPQPLHDLLFS